MQHHRTLLQRLQVFAAGGALLLLAACSTIDRGEPPALERNATWVVLPFANHTETPLAGNRAEAIAQALLHARGVGRIQRYPTTTQQEALFDAGDAKRQQEVLAWAREQQAKYALTGAVDEWRYKVGVDGEPAAGVTLQIIDVASGDTIWSGTGGKSGWSREALSGVAQKLIRDLLDSGLSRAR
ncbi:penicillin-binding protein activator LpoB [Acidovorax sp. SUPP2522]|uniref:penicillin-binding protein activator LpoB n=1 Tax=unclassified Acidovorax TaxID=2684926 RepID=UPI00234B5C82|nr:MULTISPECIES: penicillin-binding protein activator LpoB [unclassified Acidovorax]WCM98834.1 penicillin-binding protein activator LpoB [Acidovorax sp. GBBC 1281]GKS85200.1 penicillin-binding protein activator LpoB [Acidovorax sp. SUPP1855]GKS98929.1 penicillin-binding protein activator LpoB [Acidovorax sp. SUPP3434]GKT16694.1 penicillin-binding protein activator LpoB [Acidovorax sp. SUPP2522]